MSDRALFANGGTSSKQAHYYFYLLLPPFYPNFPAFQSQTTLGEKKFRRASFSGVSWHESCIVY